MKNTYLILLLCLGGLFWPACQEENPVIPLTDFYLTASIDGDSVTVLDQPSVPGRQGFYADKDSLRLGPDSCAVSYQAQFRDLGSLTLEAVYFTFNRYYTGNCANEPQVFRNLFGPGEQPVAQNNQERGWIFQWRDPEGVLWSSLPGGGSNARLQILEDEALPDDPNFGLSRHQVSGTLSCQLFDDSGQSKMLENGRFSLFIVSYEW
jgi:hypothetical protein